MSEERIDKLTRLRYRNAVRLGRREREMETVRGIYLRQYVPHGHIHARYDRAAELVLEARNLGDRIRSALREEKP